MLRGVCSRRKSTLQGKTIENSFWKEKKWTRLQFAELDSKNSAFQLADWSNLSYKRWRWRRSASIAGYKPIISITATPAASCIERKTTFLWQWHCRWTVLWRTIVKNALFARTKYGTASIRIEYRRDRNSIETFVFAASVFTRNLAESGNSSSARHKHSLVEYANVGPTFTARNSTHRWISKTNHSNS